MHVGLGSHLCKSTRGCRAGHLSVVVWLDLVGRERVPYCEAKVELGIDS